MDALLHLNFILLRRSNSFFNTLFAQFLLIMLQDLHLDVTFVTKFYSIVLKKCTYYVGGMKDQA